MEQKWPNQIFPAVNFVFSHDGHFGLGQGGGGLGGGHEATDTELSHIPPCHRHMVIATMLPGHCFAVLHRSAHQTSAESCLGFTARGGYRMFLGLCGSALTPPLALGSHEPCTLGLVSTLPHSLWLAGPVLTLSPAALITATHKDGVILHLLLEGPAGTPRPLISSCAKRGANQSERGNTATNKLDCIVLYAEQVAGDHRPMRSILAHHMQAQEAAP